MLLTYLRAAVSMSKLAACYYTLRHFRPEYALTFSVEYGFQLLELRLARTATTQNQNGQQTKLTIEIQGQLSES